MGIKQLDYDLLKSKKYNQYIREVEDKFKIRKPLRSRQQQSKPQTSEAGVRSTKTYNTIDNLKNEP